MGREMENGRGLLRAVGSIYCTDDGVPVIAMTLLGDSTRVKDTGTFLPYAHPHIWGWQPNGDPFELDAVRHGFARAGITSYWPILDRVKNDGPGTGQWGSVPFPPGDRDSTKIII